MIIDQKTTEDKNLIAFKAWYEDYAITGDSYAEWERLPEEGLQVIVFYYDTTEADTGKPVRHISYGRDSYGLSKNLRVNHNAAAKKKGNNISDKKFKEVMSKAEADRGDEWILPGTIIKQAPDFGGKMIGIPKPRKEHSKNRGAK